MQGLKSTALLLFLLAVPATGAAQLRITSPRVQFGHDIGDDYFLANYTQMIEYWQKLDRESDRMKMVRIGTTAEGRPMWMAIITSPENHARLARYQDISRRLALAENLTDAQARALATEGKAVVWIDGGLHATEVLGAQQLIQTVYELVSRTDPETLRFLRDDIILCVPANPDGQDLVSNWYMREADTLKRTTSRLPRLYQKYAGHDNNRDSYMASQPETQAMDSILFRAWYPQIMYNHHQTGPVGTVIFAPPFRDPFNYNYDPLVPMELDLVGAAMQSRFVAEGKPGATMRSGAPYSTWWNGGLRTTVYFHNMIGLLTEAIGNPTPMEIPLVVEKLLPKGDLPMPIQPQKWHFAQSIAYELTANRAVLDVASRYRETLLYNIYQMGRNSIRRGNTDTWTITPRKIAALQAALPQDTVRPAGGDAGGGGGGRPQTTSPAEMATYVSVMRNPQDRDARGYIIPANQPDFLTATKFVNALIKTGVAVQRATAAFSVGGTDYPAGSFIVKTAQAFRPHVLDMFEPQDHPNDIPYPGGPPTAPYDNAGWTLAYQMGVQFTRILEPFGGPFVPVLGFAKVPEQRVASAIAGYALSHSVNDAFTAVNRLLARGEEVFTLTSPLSINGRSYDVGTFYIPAKPTTAPIVAQLAAEKGLDFDAFDTEVSSASLRRVRPARIALWDQYGGAITSGWARFVLEQFEFPYEIVFPPTLDAGNLIGKFDVLILPDGASFARPNARATPRVTPEDVPAEYRDRVGGMTVAKTIPQLLEFLNAGGTILAIGSATDIGIQLQLPIANALTDSTGRALPRNRFYVPGSILSMRVDTTAALAQGLRPVTDFYYDNAPAFKLLPAAEPRGVKRIAWIDDAAPLRSGWAWGQKYLNGVTEVLQAPVGKGMLVLYGPDPYFRSQPHGTFKILFNGLLYRTSLGD
ncbi:MAG TPA: M14 family zinc carboxypeptidase [Gemmatimonadaceae bacterium]|nr:M14 family zinc carboxypeptidase [Gemmatimonadaceae bacterium]